MTWAEIAWTLLVVVWVVTDTISRRRLNNRVHALEQAVGGAVWQFVTSYRTEDTK